MLHDDRRFLGAGALCLSLLIPSTAAAEGLRLPTMAAAAASGADWATTYHALKYYQVREVNPVLRPLDETPGALVSTGAVLDAGIISAWNLTVGRKNERVGAAGLWAMTVFRIYLAIHNMRNETKAARR